MDNFQSNIKGGKLLVELRKQANLSQGELAKKAGVSRSMIAQLELGERRPSQKLLKTLSQAFNMKGEEEAQLFLAYDFSSSSEAPDQIAAFLRADNNLTPEQAEDIAKIVRRVYNKYVAEE